MHCKSNDGSICSSQLTKSRSTSAEQASTLSLAKYKSNSPLEMFWRRNSMCVFTHQSLQAQEPSLRHKTGWTCSPPGMKSHPTRNLQTRNLVLPKKRKQRKTEQPSQQRPQNDTSSKPSRGGMEARRKGQVQRVLWHIILDRAWAFFQPSAATTVTYKWADRL